jgi:TonB family protein
MLQPLQIRDVSMRYAAEIAELRDFLAKSGLGLETAETLARMSARLREDRAFRRDLTSHLWVVIHGSEAQVRQADLLAMLAVAAAGPHFAADAGDNEAHDLLRFVMQVWGSFNATNVAAPVSAVVPSLLPSAPRRDLAPAPFMRGAPPQQDADLSFEMPQEADDHRRVLWIGGVAAACALLALATGLLLHHNTPARPAAPIASTAAPVEQTTPRVLANSDAGQPVQHSEGRAAVAQRSSRPAPYSILPESARDLPEASRSLRAKPSPAIPMAPTHATVASLKPAPQPFARTAHTPLAAKPTVVSASGSSYVPKAVPVDMLRLRGSGTSAGTTRQAIVRPTSLGIMAANVTYSPAPTYPASAAAARVQGEVKLEAEVGRDGTVESTRIISGPPLLADAAVNAVQHWRYRPYLYEGKPIAMNAQIVMDFQLP